MARWCSPFLLSLLSLAVLCSACKAGHSSASGTGYGGASESSGGAEPSGTASSGGYGNSTSSGSSGSSSGSSGSNGGSNSSNPRISFIETMHGFQGFVYDIDELTEQKSCPSTDDFQNDFKAMKQLGTTAVITFGVCGGKETDESYYGDLISASNDAEIYIIPLVWTLSTNGQSFEDYAVPIMNAVISAVKAAPNAVLAVALGDEPLYDNDAGSADALAKYITQMKQEFTSAGLDIPVSISDMAYGWQQAGDVSSMVEAVDFFMINNFPYFGGNAKTADSDTAWSDFTNDIKYFQGIANGKPLLVTQTGWPDNTDEFGAQFATSDLTNEEAYWKVLNGHCSDYFAPNKLGWMWRSYGDNIAGWGIVDSSGKTKFDPTVTTC